MTATVTRLGFLLPAANTTIEAETAGVAAESAWTAHYQRLPSVLGAEHDVNDVVEGVVLAARVLAAARPDVIGLAYTAGSYLYPESFDAMLPVRLERETGCRLVTAAEAIVARLRDLGIQRVAVVSPYPRTINDACVSYFARQEFEVVSVVGEPSAGPGAAVPVGRIAELVREAVSTEPDGVVISCTALRTLAALPKLREDLGVPMTSSNDALIWAMVGGAD